MNEAELNETVARQLYESYGDSRDYPTFIKNILEGFELLGQRHAKPDNSNRFEVQELQKMRLALEYNQQAMLYHLRQDKPDA